MSGSSFLPFGNSAPTPLATDPAARLEAVASRLEKIAWINLIVAGLIFLTIVALLI